MLCNAEIITKTYNAINENIQYGYEIESKNKIEFLACIYFCCFRLIKSIIY